jgi:ubiquinone/menaquinone biosynthesis C-methylase UbiE
MVKPFIRGKVLEIGAGHRPRRGSFKPPIGNCDGWLYLDINESRQPDVQATILSLPFQNSVFDTVVCLEVLEYASDPSGAVNELARVVSRGGCVLLSAPFIHPVDSSDDYWRFTQHALTRLVEEAGLSVERVCHQGHRLGSVLGLLSQLVKDWQPSRIRPVLTRLFTVLARFDREALGRTYTTGFLIIATNRKHGS